MLSSGTTVEGVIFRNLPGFFLSKKNCIQPSELRSFTHLVIYTSSSLVEQTTPVSLLLSDAFATVQNLHLGGFLRCGETHDRIYGYTYDRCSIYIYRSQVLKWFTGIHLVDFSGKCRFCIPYMNPFLGNVDCQHQNDCLRGPCRTWIWMKQIWVALWILGRSSGGSALKSKRFNDHTRRWRMAGRGKSSLFGFIGGFESPKSYGHFANMIW